MSSLIAGVFALCHKRSGRVYLGHSSNIFKDLARLFFLLTNGRSPLNQLASDFILDGVEGFLITILEQVQDKDSLTSIFNQWVSQHQSEILKGRAFVLP